MGNQHLRHHWQLQIDWLGNLIRKGSKHWDTNFISDTQTDPPSPSPLSALPIEKGQSFILPMWETLSPNLWRGMSWWKDPIKSKLSDQKVLQADVDTLHLRPFAHYYWTQKIFCDFCVITKVSLLEVSVGKHIICHWTECHCECLWMNILACSAIYHIFFSLCRVETGHTD